jgi:hypothetical protein
MRRRHLLAIAAFAFAALTCRSASARKEAALQPALDRIVAAHAGWHLGGTEDCKNQYLARMQGEHPGYSPYRAIGDFDADGMEDAVAVLIKGDSGLVYWLRGTRSAYAEPLQVGALDWASDGGLFVDGNNFSFGVFYSDVVFTWGWDPHTRKFRDVSEHLNDSTQ